MKNKSGWKEVRKQGMLIYILSNWILCAALPASLILTVLRWLMQDRGIIFFTSGTFLYKLALSFMLCSIFAFICGIRKWFKNEKVFKSAES